MARIIIPAMIDRKNTSTFFVFISCCFFSLSLTSETYNTIEYAVLKYYGSLHMYIQVFSAIVVVIQYYHPELNSLRSISYLLMVGGAPGRHAGCGISPSELKRTEKIEYHSRNQRICRCRNESEQCCRTVSEVFCPIYSKKCAQCKCLAIHNNSKFLAGKVSFLRRCG